MCVSKKIVETEYINRFQKGGCAEWDAKAARTVFLRRNHYEKILHSHFCCSLAGSLSFSIRGTGIAIGLRHFRPVLVEHHGAGSGFPKHSHLRYSHAILRVLDH